MPPPVTPHRPVPDPDVEPSLVLGPGLEEVDPAALGERHQDSSATVLAPGRRLVLSDRQTCLPSCHTRT